MKWCYHIPDDISEEQFSVKRNARYNYVLTIDLRNTYELLWVGRLDTIYNIMQSMEVLKQNTS